MNTMNTRTTFCAFSPKVAARIGVSHKALKRHIRGVISALDCCLCEHGYYYEDAKGREKYGYMMPKQLLWTVLAGYGLTHIADELLEPVEWEVEEVA